MASDEFGVKIIADASGVAPETDKVREGFEGLADAIKGLSSDLNGLSEKTVAGLKRITSTAAETKDKVEEIGHAGEAGFGGMIHKIHEGAEAVRTFQMRAKEFAEVYVAAFAVDRIKEFISSLAEGAEHVRNLGLELGMTTKQIQALQGITAQTGVSTETLAHGVGLLEEKIATTKGTTSGAAKALALLGVSANDGKSAFERMMTAADGIKNLADKGINPLSVAMMAFGRSGKEMLPALMLGSKGIDEIITKSKDYNVISDESQAKGMELAESVNSAKLAYSGLTNTLTTALSPIFVTITGHVTRMIEAMVASYNSGGTMRVIADDLTVAFGALQKVIDGVVSAFGFVSDHFQIFLPLLVGVGTYMAGPYIAALVAAAFSTGTLGVATTLLAAAFEINGIAGVVAVAYSAITGAATFAAEATWAFTTALLANPLTWLALAATAAAAGIYYLAQHTTSAKEAFVVFMDGVHIALEAVKGYISATLISVKNFGVVVRDVLSPNWGAISSDWQTGLQLVENDVAATTKRIKALVDDAKKHMVFDDGAKPAGTKKTGNDDVTKGGAKGTVDLSNTPKPKPKKAPKEADTKVQEYRNELAEMLLLEENWGKDTVALTAEFWKKKLALGDLSKKQRAQVEAEVTKSTKALYQEQETAAIASIKAVEATKLEASRTEIDLDRIGLQSKLATLSAEEKDGKVNTIKAAQQRAVLNAQLLALDRQLELAEYKIKQQSLQDQLKTDHITLAESTKLKQQLLQLEQQHLNKMKVLDAKATADALKNQQTIASAQTKVFDQTFQNFSQNIAKMVTLQQGFTTSITNMYMGLVNIAEQAVQQMVQNWIVGLLTKDAASATAHVKENLRTAKAAAGHAWDAVVGIPFVGPVLAPVAAAAAFAGVMAFSAAGGFGDVPEDGTMTSLHKREMVLPADIATPLRGMLTSRGGGSLSSAANGGAQASTDKQGDVHLHVHATDAASVKRLFMDNKHVLANVLQDAFRNGVRT